MVDTLKALLLLCGAYLDARPFVAAEKLGLPPELLWKTDSKTAQQLQLKETALERIRALEAKNWAEREYEACMEKDVKLIFYGCDDYPQALYDLPQPPSVLYWQGCGKPLSARTVGVVGTRRSSSYGLRTAETI